jgi:DNA-binding NtrC family response regulator
MQEAKGMTAYLKSEGGPKKFEWELLQGENLIGRDPEGSGNKIYLDPDMIPGGDTISRRHVRIHLDGEAAVLSRLPETNLVLVNEKELGAGDDAIALRSGDRLVLGKAAFQFDLRSGKRSGSSRKAGERSPSPFPPDTVKSEAAEVLELRRRNERLEGELRAVEGILKGDTPESVLENVLGRIVQAFDLQCGVVADWDVSSDRLKGRAFIGLERISDLSNISQRIIREALVTGKPFLTHDAPRDARIRDATSGAIEAYEIRQALCAPLLCGKERLGAIYLDNRRVEAGRPFTEDDERALMRLAEIVAGAIGIIRNRQRAELKEILANAQIVGRGETMLKLAASIRRVARALDRNPRIPVLIQGPPGAGKELVARAIRLQLARRSKAYVTVNMGRLAANPELSHSAIFGHRRGSFTNAVEDRMGAVGASEGGVLFFDEVGDMPKEIQLLLKEFLAEETYGKYSRLGEDEKKRSSDVVVMMATNKDLLTRAKEGEFEADVVRRLMAGHVVQVPALSQHREDIPDIVNHYLCQFNEHYGRQIFVSKEGMDILCSTEWQFNVGGLRAAVQKLILDAEGDGPVVIGPRHIERCLKDSASNAEGELRPMNLMERPLWEVDLDHCLAVWEWCTRNYRSAAEKLQIAENTLRKKLIEGLLRRFRSPERAAKLLGKTLPELEQDVKTYKAHTDAPL